MNQPNEQAFGRILVFDWKELLTNSSMKDKCIIKAKEKGGARVR